MSGAGRAATPALARRHEVLADSGATHTIAEEERMTKGNDIVDGHFARLERRFAALGLDPQLHLRPWLDVLRKVDDPRRELEDVAHLCAVSRGTRRPLTREIAIETIEMLAALHDMDVDAEAMVARAEAETHPLGLTVIEGGGGGSPPTSPPAGGSPPTATPPAAA